MGRPSKFTPEVREIILDAIEGGNFYATACDLASVSYKTFREWVRRGGSGAAADAEFRAFRDAVKRATAAAEVAHVKNICDAGKKQWQASAWYLERKHPERWARRDSLDGVDPSKMTDEQLAKVAGRKGRR